MNSKHQNLIGRYNGQLASEEELKEIEQLILAGEIDLEELHDLKLLEERIMLMEEPLPSIKLDNSFYKMLSEQKRTVKARIDWNNIFSWSGLFPKVAIASVALIAGFWIGYAVKLPSNKTELSSLSKEVSDLKEMMMLSLLEKESASERLKAVSLTEEMNDASANVTQALLETLNHDVNINVRLAALEALVPYSKDSHIRAELVRSIVRQDSPLVQVALAELMVTLQEKSSVKELQKILQNEKTPHDVKKKIKQSITVLT